MYPPRAIVALADRQTHGSTKDPSPMQRKTARPLISILIQYLKTHHLRPWWDIWCGWRSTQPLMYTPVTLPLSNTRLPTTSTKHDGWSSRLGMISFKSTFTTEDRSAEKSEWSCRLNMQVALYTLQGCWFRNSKKSRTAIRVLLNVLKHWLSSNLYFSFRITSYIRDGNRLIDTRRYQIGTPYLTQRSYSGKSP